MHEVLFAALKLCFDDQRLRETRSIEARPNLVMMAKYLTRLLANEELSSRSLSLYPNWGRKPCVAVCYVADCLDFLLRGRQTTRRISTRKSSEGYSTVRSSQSPPSCCALTTDCKVAPKGNTKKSSLTCLNYCASTPVH